MTRNGLGFEPHACGQDGGIGVETIAKLVNMQAEDVYSLMCEGPGPAGPPQPSQLRSMCRLMSQHLHAGLPPGGGLKPKA